MPMIAFKRWLRGDAHADPNLKLEAQRIVMTCDLLAQRIEYRLPGRNLVKIAVSLRRVAGQAVARSEEIRRPNVPLRVLSGLLVVGMLAVVAKLVGYLRFTDAPAWDMLEGIDAGISTIIYLGVAMVFVITIEGRIRRRRALAAVQELRALAHVIDMHQIPKDPERLAERYAGGPEYGSQPLNPYDLGRYLDYCSDLLSLLSKVAVLSGYNTQDAVVLAGVDEIERLTTGLSQKIWQKIMILDQIIEHSEKAAAPKALPAHLGEPRALSPGTVPGAGAVPGAGVGATTGLAGRSSSAPPRDC